MVRKVVGYGGKVALRESQFVIISPCFVTEVNQGRIRWVVHAASLRKFGRACSFFETCWEETSRDI